MAGYFEPETVAESVDPSNAVDIARGVMVLAARVPEVRRRCMQEARAFDWNQIGMQYVKLYEGALRCPSN